MGEPACVGEGVWGGGGANLKLHDTRSEKGFEAHEAAPRNLSVIDRASMYFV